MLFMSHFQRLADLDMFEIIFCVQAGSHNGSSFLFTYKWVRVPLAKGHQSWPGCATFFEFGSLSQVADYVLVPSPRIGEAVAAAGVLSGGLARRAN